MLMLKRNPDVIRWFRDQWFAEYIAGASEKEVTAIDNLAKIDALMGPTKGEIVRKENEFSYFVPLKEVEAYWGTKIWEQYKDFAKKAKPYK